jgi:hypothetical protein
LGRNSLPWGGTVSLREDKLPLERKSLPSGGTVSLGEDKFPSGEESLSPGGKVSLREEQSHFGRNSLPWGGTVSLGEEQSPFGRRSFPREEKFLSGLLYTFNAVAGFTRGDIHLNGISHAAVFERAPYWRLDGDPPIAGIHFPWPDQDIIQLLIELQVAQNDFAAEAGALIGGLALDDARGFDLSLEPVDLPLHLAHAPLGLVVGRILTKVAVLVRRREIVANRGGHDRLEMVQLSLELLQAFARQLDYRRLFLAGVGRATFAPHTQARAEIRLGQTLGLHIRQEGLQRFHARGSLARRIGQVLLVALNFELGNAGNLAVGADVPHETIDLTCG